MNIQVSRRNLLKSTGALVVSFSLAGKAGQALAQGARRKAACADRCRFLPRHRQGRQSHASIPARSISAPAIRTALAQMAAEELDVPFNSVSMVTGDTMLTPDQGTTWGSLTIQAAGMQIRNAAATARNFLLEDAAKKLNLKQDDLIVADGVVVRWRQEDHLCPADRRQVVRHEGERQGAKTKDPKAFKLVGKSVAARRHP